ncbi:RNA polymerase subunit sigma-54 [Minwuia thermotolerans]|uniref:RNA polymerase subunit sigma-54 n=1 Tax=Minwuia thermotolerans TaxID=2056226 RepID=A0A2M9G2V3_9PROT|nr:RNA polymerase subunit sigma-54 [Minwuia thermotolerans]
MAGAALVVLSTMGFSVMHAMIQYLGKQGLHGFEIAFFRNLFGIVALTPIFIRYGLEPFRTTKIKLHFARGAVNAVAMLLFFYGITTGIALGLVQSLSFTAPLFTSLLAVLFLGEKMRAHRWTALAIGFLGTLVILRPGMSAIEPGAVYILLAAMMWGVAMTIIKRLTDTDSAITVSLYMVLMLTPISGIAAAFVWTWPTAEQFIWLAAIGVIGTFSQMAFAQAFRLADATAVLPFDFSKLFWSALLGWFFFAQVLDLWVWIGSVMIFAGGFYIAYRERKITGKSPPVREPARPV